ncbi:MAG: DinB family protein [Chloroflexota bacterium]|nr:DinB family protein [Chloroflexota bacterium]
MDRTHLLQRIGERWQTFNDSFAGLPDAALQEPGVTGEWSVVDVVAHVTTWEEETLKALTLLMEGARPPQYGGVDAFNARESARKRALSLAVVHRQAAETHQRLLAFVQAAPERHFATETTFRRRLRLDTYSHYPEHTRAILAWRQARGL